MKAGQPRARRASQLSGEASVFQWLSLYRYFTLMLAVLVMLVMPVTRGLSPSLGSYIILGVVAFYVVARVLLPGRPGRRTLITYLHVGIEMCIGLGPMLLSGGLQSGLLFYALTPILFASLLLQQKIALYLAGLMTLALGAAYTYGSLLFRAFPFILEDSNLAFLLLFAVTCFVVATVPYQTNLNLRQRLMRQAVMDERRRLRQEVHDTLAQELGFLSLQARQIQDALPYLTPEKLLSQVTALQRSLQRSYISVREHLDALSLEQDFHLVPALAELGREFSAASGIVMETALPKGETGLPPMAEVQLIRVVQEALSNVRKHSEARHVWLTMSTYPRTVELLVKDDGRGFDPTELPARGGYGLRNIRERVEGLGGTVTITSSPGQGTLVRVVLPQ